MAEFALFVGLMCRRLSAIRTCHDLITFERIKLRLLVCAGVLVAGCSTLTTHHGASVPRPEEANKAAVTAPTEAQPIAADTPKWELSVPDHPAIDAWVRNFTGVQHRSFQIQLDRARFYAVPAQEIFERQGLPKDLIFVALVESGFTPTARSHASAVGMWQFISSTGKRFGLEQNQWIDERCHPQKAARAAAEYLSFLFDTFGSWSLALAAYNAGEKAVQTELDRSGLKTFWELAEIGYLPSETRDYVPKVLATVRIIRNPRLYGFHFNPQHYVQRDETVSVPGGVRLSWIGKHCGIPESELKTCNPELCRSVTPPGCSIYDLYVPIGTKDAVLAALAERPLDEEKPERKAAVAASRSGDALVKTKPGDTLSSLARKYKCSIKALADLNGFDPTRPLKAGQVIRIRELESSVKMAAVRATKKKGGNTASGREGRELSQSARKSDKPLYYTVRKGDTLWSIAERFHISVDRLCGDNKLKRNVTLVPGNPLKISTWDKDSVRVAKR